MISAAQSFLQYQDFTGRLQGQPVAPWLPLQARPDSAHTSLEYERTLAPLALEEAWCSLASELKSATSKPGFRLVDITPFPGSDLQTLRIVGGSSGKAGVKRARDGIALSVPVNTVLLLSRFQGELSAGLPALPALAARTTPKGTLFYVHTDALRRCRRAAADAGAGEVAIDTLGASHAAAAASAAATAEPRAALLSGLALPDITREFTPSKAAFSTLRQPRPTSDGTWCMWHAGNAVSSLRELAAVYTVARSMAKPIVAGLLSGANAQPDDSAHRLALPSVLEAKFNHSQLEAIQSAGARASGITLIQGPPGTGKTATISAIVNVLHVTAYGQFHERLLRGNAAVDLEAEASAAEAAAAAAAAAAATDARPDLDAAAGTVAELDDGLPKFSPATPKEPATFNGVHSPVDAAGWAPTHLNFESDEDESAKVESPVLSPGSPSGAGTGAGAAGPSAPRSPSPPPSPLPRAQPGPRPAARSTRAAVAAATARPGSALAAALAHAQRQAAMSAQRGQAKTTAAHQCLIDWLNDPQATPMLAVRLGHLFMQHKPRILVTAHSNTAVDNIVKRLIQQKLYDMLGNTYAPPVVRVGMSSDPAIMAAGVLLSAKVGEYLGKPAPTLNAKVMDHEQQLKAVLHELQHFHTEFLARKAEFVFRFSGQELERELQNLTNGFAPYVLDAVKRAHAAEHELRKLKLALLGHGKEPGAVATARTELEHAVLLESELVFTTLISSAVNAVDDFAANQDDAFPIVLVDEAGQATEPATLVPLRYGATRAVLVGDPAQLPATVLSQEAKAAGLETSLFARLSSTGAQVHLLNTQYRMHPVISAWPAAEFYGGKLLDGPGLADKRGAPWHTSQYGAPLQFFDVTWGGEERTDAKSLINHAEADVVAWRLMMLAACMRNKGDARFTVGVLSPYAAQADLLRGMVDRLSRRSDWPAACLAKPEVLTVDGAQGQEWDVVILSTVRAQAGSSTDPRTASIGFLQDLRRMNVGLTRARRSMWVVGHAASLRGHCVWAKFLAHCEQASATVPVQRHGMNAQLAKLAPDWQRGGARHAGRDDGGWRAPGL